MSLRPSRPPSRRLRDSVIVIASAAIGLVGVLTWITTAAARREHAAYASGVHSRTELHADHAAMSNEEMERWVEAWYAEHPMRGLGVAAGPPVATYIASGITFNADGNPNTIADTVRIFTGETVKWQRLDGSHTVTNGVDISDPQAGSLFDVALNLTTTTFMFTFSTAGTYPFFCRPHGGLGMRGVIIATDPVIGAEIEVRNFAFVRAGGPATNAETVPIVLNQAVRWKWVEGAHTVTNGLDSGDPGAGAQFDVPIGESATEFVQVFRSLGDVPYFCRPHEANDMRGTIRVLPPEVVGIPGATSAGTIGFTAGPQPNPTRGGVQFRFALVAGGRARVRVLDARGARVADVLDRPLEPGEHTAGWDGRTATGEPAAPGVYFLHLAVPGHESSRRFVLAH